MGHVHSFRWIDFSEIHSKFCPWNHFVCGEGKDIGCGLIKALCSADGAYYTFTRDGGKVSREKKEERK